MMYVSFRFPEEWVLRGVHGIYWEKHLRKDEGEGAGDRREPPHSPDVQKERKST